MSVGVGVGVGVPFSTPSWWLPTEESTLEAWWRADSGVTGVPASAWLDQKNSYNALQVVGAFQPAYGDDTGPGKRPALTFTGTEFFSVVGGITNPSDDWSLWVVFTPTAITGIHDVICCQTGPVVHAALRDVAGTPYHSGYDSSSWTSVPGSPLLVPQSLRYKWDSGASLLSVYRNGVLMGSAATDGTIPMGGACGLGAYYNGSGQQLLAHVSEIIICASSSLDPVPMDTYIVRRYGWL